VYNKCRQEDNYYNASNQAFLKDSISVYVNALLKSKFAKYKQIFDDTLLGLFLHRLKVLQLAFTLNLPAAELNYLESKDILDHVVESPATNPTLFINSVQSYFGVQMSPDYNRAYRQDYFTLLSKS